MNFSEDWVGAWVCDKLISHDQIIGATLIENQLIRLQVKDYEPDVVVAVMSQKKVFLSNIPSICQSLPVDFLLNIPRNAYFDGDILSYAESNSFGVGGLGDLYIAVNQKEFQSYLPQETRFILRGLRQHTAVSNVTRINNQTYLIVRFSRNSLRVLALNDYDLTADAIRTGIDMFGKCDLILASNPNCRLSSGARDAACSAGTSVLMWRQLLGVINNA
jgi:hypothetical protein